MKTVIGIDLGDKHNVAVVFDNQGNEVACRRMVNTKQHVERFFHQYPGAVVVMEAGTHSPWISRLLAQMGHEVHVGNPRKLRAIWDADDKSDERDARILGLMYRMEPRLLHTIQHRNAQAQADLAYIKTRQQLVECRSKLINYARSMVKGVGERIPSGGADTFHRRAREHMPEMLSKAMEPLIQTIEELTAKIQGLDKLLLKMSEKRYPETAYVMQIDGVGPVTGLAFVLTLEDPERFQKSRTVGAFLGMTPKRDQSGDKDKQLRITKAGNTYLRALLINCAQRIMGPFGKDCALRRYGERIAARGGKIAKKRAVVAVARKLAVVMHKLWRDQAEYVPFKHGKKHAA